MRWLYRIKNNHYTRGIWAEYYAAFVLIFKGYRILGLRYKTKVGEIDLVARKGNVTIFTEVKFRDNEADALEAVTHK